MDKSKIEWTDATWNPVVGCTPVSPGCLNCYAATMSRRLEAMGQQRYVGLTVKRDNRAVFNGKVRTVFDVIDQPLRWKRPRMIFVNSMSDLFHESVPFSFIDEVFAVMHVADWHTFQVLTKRPERAAKYLNERQRPPLPNVWIGTSAEDQPRLDERVPHLLECPAAVRFLSCEPLLGPLDLSAFFGGKYVALPGDRIEDGYNFGIQWVIVGGESGPHARPCDVAWVRSIVEQCTAAHVRVFVKQLGAYVHCRNDHVSRWLDELGMGLDYIDTSETRMQGDPVRVMLNDRKGGDMAEWPADLRVREMPRMEE